MPEQTAHDMLAEPLQLPCGAVIPNRLCKAAMTEGLGDAQMRATERHVRLYQRWGAGGAGLCLTGNVMIDRWVIERPGNVTIDTTHPPTMDEDARKRLRAWAEAGTAGGNHLWMQISHAGRQSPRYAGRRPLGPSAVKLDLLGNYQTPRALQDAEICEIVQRFATAAAVAKETGFSGVQIHAAHGYLISSFLSPVTNLRDDRWGGNLVNRARLLLEVVRATRLTVGKAFPVSVKLNSDDFRKGGFSHEDCLAVVKMLNDERIDLLEVSGGTYEQPQLLGLAGRDNESVAVRRSTRVREAYFLHYASQIRRQANMPMMVTGGFRSRPGMEEAIGSGDTDMIGIGRPFCTLPNAAQQLLDGSLEKLPNHEQALRLAANGWRSPASPIVLFKVLNMLGAQGWFYHQIERLADGKEADLDRGMMRSFAVYLWLELSRTVKLRR